MKVVLRNIILHFATYPTLLQDGSPQFYWQKTRTDSKDVVCTFLFFGMGGTRVFSTATVGGS